MNRNLPQVRRPFGEIDQLFGSLLGAPMPSRNAWFLPAVDRIDSDESTVYKFDMPGVSREDVNITVERGQLVVRGERKSEHESAGYTERSYGSFERTLPLPENIDEEAIDASLDSGVLSVTIPRSQDKNEPRQISIK